MNRNVFFAIILLVSILPNGLVKAQYHIAGDTIDIDEVVISANRIEISRKNAALSVSLISAEEISNSDESSLLPVLSDMSPGVFVTERGITGFGVSTGSAGAVSIRGISGSPNTRVLIMMDGQPQFAGIFGHPLPDSYVASDAERIEIIRGPASLIYGSNAMGGVVNIISRKNNNPGFSGNLRGMYGSYNTMKIMGNASYTKDDFKVFASINHDQTDGHRANSDFDITNGFLKTSYSLNKNFEIRADANLAKFKSYDPGTNENPYEGHWIDILRGMTSLSLNTNFKNSEGALKLSYNFGEHDIYDGFHSWDEMFSISAYQGFDIIKGNTTTFGVDYVSYGGKAENKEAMGGAGMVFGDERILEGGAYITSQQELFRRLTLNAGLRLQHNELYGQEWIPQFGASFMLTPALSFKTLVSKGFRSPTMRELYLWGTANEDLKPERMWNYEAGLLNTWNELNMSTELSVFLVKGSNLIQTVFNGVNPQYMNSGEFENSGLEFSWKYRMNPKWNFMLNYTYLHLKEALLAAPRHQLFMAAEYRSDKLGLYLCGRYIEHLITQIGDQSEGIEEKTSTYLTFDTRLSYYLNEHIDFFIKGENLSDVSYEINYGYPMPGITFMGGFRLHMK